MVTRIWNSQIAGIVKKHAENFGASLVAGFEAHPSALEFYSQHQEVCPRIYHQSGVAGGWFDASADKPQVQVQTAKGGQWETVGVLKDYPATTATSTAGLHGGERFHCQLSAPVRAWAERSADNGYPERYAQRVLGQNSKMVHRAYAKKAQGQLPSLEDYEAAMHKAKKTGKVVVLEHEAEMPRVK